MLDQVAAAVDRQDYRTAAQLLKALLKQSPHDPWVQFYAARVQEAAGKLDAADRIYRQLLRDSSQRKLIAQARQGIERIAALRTPPSLAEESPQSAEQGFLVLESVTGDARPQAVQALAQATQVDRYTAQLLLPNRGWRLYRAGSVRELQALGQTLRSAGLPTCWATRSELNAIQVFQVQSVQQVAPKVTIVCRNQQAQLGQLSFDWVEVTQQVQGLLPIFEQVVDLGYRDRLERREKTQDYSQICDLHLPQRRCILRFQDSQYDFEAGIALLSSPVTLQPHPTLRAQWNQVLQGLNQRLPQAPVWSDFTAFGESAADFAAPLDRLPSQVRILRQVGTHWDTAFELYSRLIFLHPR
jgi:tetratricopeptide (TPR) repeat protein